MNMPLTVFAVVIGGCLSVVGSLIVLNLRSIKQCITKFERRIEKQDNAVRELETGFTACKIDCDRTFVNSEVFLRETGFARRTLENLSSSVSRLEGKLTVVEKLPQICGDISREIVKEMKNGAQNGQ